MLLVANWNNRFYIGNGDFYISFDRFNQEIFNMIRCNSGDFLLTTGPGGFIGTRSIAGFLLGFCLGTKRKIYGFNLLLDILPPIAGGSLGIKEPIYIYQDLNRFFYKSKESQIEERQFSLINPQEVSALKSDSNLYLIGNWSQCDIFIELDFKLVYETMLPLVGDKYLFRRIDYCNW